MGETTNQIFYTLCTMHYNTNTNRFPRARGGPEKSEPSIFGAGDLIKEPSRHDYAACIATCSYMIRKLFWLKRSSICCSVGSKRTLLPRPQLNINRYEAEHHCRMYESRFCMIIDDT